MLAEMGWVELELGPLNRPSELVFDRVNAWIDAVKDDEV